MLRFITLALMVILLTTALYCGGFNTGYDLGLKTGEAECLMSNHGMCFKHNQ